jgi:hypothetical protein
MNPTIPNVEGSIFENQTNTDDPQHGGEKVNEQISKYNPNKLQDVESRESKIGSSGGGQPQDDDSDEARKQVSSITSDQPSDYNGDAQQATVVNDSDDDTNSQADSTFVHKVEEVISKTKGDPELRVNKMAQVQAEFILKRFNHQIKSLKLEEKEG